MDLSTTIAPKSDQQNFDDYLSGPKTVTITEVRAGSDEQPVEIHLAEFPGRPYKPSKSMRRVLVTAWGADGSAYVGRRMTLYGDPDVKFGGVTTGGIKVSHLSHLAQPLRLALTATRGKKAPHTVQPLADQTPRKTGPVPGILQEIAEAALAVGMSKQQVADRWASDHDEPIGKATDTAALEALRDELRGQAAPTAEDPPGEPLWPATPPIPA